MTSTAYKHFETIYNRGYSMVSQSVKLLQALREMGTQGPTVAEYNHIPYIAESGRAGIVTVVAAFDRYFTARYAECVTPVLKSEGPSDGLLTLLENAGLDLRGALELLHAKRPHRKIRNLIDSHFEDFTTQRFDVIDRLFLSLGIGAFSLNVQAHANKKRLIVSIQHLIRRRHVIVHAGDLNRYHKLRSVDPYDTKKRMRNVKLFVRTSDQVIESRMRACRR